MRSPAAFRPALREVFRTGSDAGVRVGWEQHTDDRQTARRDRRAVERTGVIRNARPWPILPRENPLRGNTRQVIKNQRSDTTQRSRRDMPPIIGLKFPPPKPHYPKKSRRGTQKTRTSAPTSTGDERRPIVRLA